ncbi:hypothetical protein BH23ACT6_BH23ACT6_02920 [soil metagenome]
MSALRRSRKTQAPEVATRAPVIGRRALVASAAVLFPASVVAISGCAGERSVQVTGGVSAGRAMAYRELAERGIADVEDLWGSGSVPLPIRLDLPATAAGWALATSQQDQTLTYAASTVWRGATGHIVVHPAMWSEVTPEGRSAVIAHEISHLVMGNQPHMPWWITEGLAEYTAHRGSDRSLEDIAGSALGRLSANPPPRWPQRSGSADPWQDYAPAWLACVYLAQAYDESLLLDLHADVAADVPLDTALQRRSGARSTEVHQSWVAWLRQL